MDDWLWAILWLVVGAGCGAALALAIVVVVLIHLDTADLALTVRVLEDKLREAQEIARTVLELKRRLDGD